VESLQQRLRQVAAGEEERPLELDGAPALEVGEVREVVLKLQNLLHLKEQGNK